MSLAPKTQKDVAVLQHVKIAPRISRPCPQLLPTGLKAFISQVEEANTSLPLHFINTLKGSRNGPRGSIQTAWENKQKTHPHITGKTGYHMKHLDTQQ